VGRKTAVVKVRHFGGAGGISKQIKNSFIGQWGGAKGGQLQHSKPGNEEVSERTRTGMGEKEVKRGGVVKGKIIHSSGLHWKPA